jgi:hypothetical protein
MSSIAVEIGPADRLQAYSPESEIAITRRASATSA